MRFLILRVVKTFDSDNVAALAAAAVVTVSVVFSSPILAPVKVNKPVPSADPVILSAPRPAIAPVITTVSTFGTASNRSIVSLPARPVIESAAPPSHETAPFVASKSSKMIG